MKKSDKSFDRILNEIFAASSANDQQSEPSERSDERYELADSEDIDILMHRNAHFGGSFEVMLDYYQGEGKGIQEEFSPSRMEYLHSIEQKTGQDLSLQFFDSYERELVGRVREAYSKLRAIYDSTEDPEAPAKLIADLVLSEEEEPQEEITAIVKRGKLMVPYLLQLLNAQEFYLSIYPGYGQAPLLAAQCLGLIKDPEAIVPLFEALKSGDFFTEESVVGALAAIGDQAKAFLLRTVIARPLTPDNELAARVLTHFSENPDVSHICLQQLDDPAVCKHENLAAYLVLACAGLTQPDEQKTFSELAHRAALQDFQQDIQAIVRSFKR